MCVRACIVCYACENASVFLFGMYVVCGDEGEHFKTITIRQSLWIPRREILFSVFVYMPECVSAFCACLTDSYSKFTVLQSVWRVRCHPMIATLYAVCSYDSPASAQVCLCVSYNDTNTHTYTTTNTTNTQPNTASYRAISIRCKPETLCYI